jgi:hypothetical protein
MKTPNFIIGKKTIIFTPHECSPKGTVNKSMSPYSRQSIQYHMKDYRK